MTITSVLRVLNLENPGARSTDTTAFFMAMNTRSIRHRLKALLQAARRLLRIAQSESSSGREGTYRENRGECLANAMALVRLCRLNYLKLVKRVHQADSRISDQENVFQVVVADVTEAAIRISDSVIKQLLMGHPDTAMATCRQLFELSVYLHLIVNDTTKERARRYHDFEFANALKRQIEIAELIDINDSYTAALNMRGQLEEFNAIYPGERFGTDDWAIVTPEDKPAKMDTWLEQIAKAKAEGHEAGQKLYEQQLKQEWLLLNKWAHATYSSHKPDQRLGPRGHPTRLLGPSNKGFDSPLIIFGSKASDILENFIEACRPYAESETENMSQEIWTAHEAILASIKKVNPDLRSDDFRMVYVVHEKDVIRAGDSHLEAEEHQLDQ